ncbi:NRAMP family divalent metal transporter [Acidiferrobacter sp. SPIII_3]|uniref:NRAMP family divalent metal transporter n=1 Tax=Acidiferrobacter sp. SPIII_3 TaxID=1281578 RepID=UPI00197AD82A|nr:divalent metal cation transporter [Acidiferrobacter sp. SPIII_3]
MSLSRRRSDTWSRPWRALLAVLGPGLVVMLADTDAGSVITAAQSGAQWGYRLLLLQVVLIPILYIVQELTVRLGIVTGEGHGELIARRFGRGWAWLSVGTLALSCLGALLTELSGMAGVGLLFGVPRWVTMIILVGGLIVMVWTASYAGVERVALAVGAFEFAFLLVALRTHQALGPLVRHSLHIPFQDPGYLYLAAANVGAVIMPWMVFYQQSAVVDKRLRIDHLTMARVDTALGAVVTQLIMAAVLVATAATIGRNNPHAPLNTVQQIADALTPFLGQRTGRLLFALGMSGAAAVATIVVSLTAARGVGEVMGFKHSLEHHPREAPWFYGIYTTLLVLGGVLVASDVNLVTLGVAMEVMNAVLLPIVLGFLYLLARHALSGPLRLQGPYAGFVLGIIVLTAGFGLYAAVNGIAVG